MFEKYSSIENLENLKITWFPQVDLREEKFVVLDKIDGSNISFCFEPGKECKIASRNNSLGSYKTCDFQGFQQVVQKPIFQQLIEEISKISTEGGSKIQLYGEIFGPNILKRVWYGSEVGIRFFDVKFDGQYRDFSDFEFWLQYLGFNELIVPVLARKVSWIEATTFPVEFQDPLCQNSKQFRAGNPQNLSEGVVVRPYSKEYFSAEGTRFILKRKNPAFAEIKVKKTPGEGTSKTITPALVNMAQEFAQYINMNRVMSCFSKMGQIESIRDIGKYIGPILQDAEEDFLKTREDWGKDERRYCLKQVTPSVVSLLQQCLVA